MPGAEGSSKAARAARSRERRAAKKANEDAWKAQVDAHFAFLRERYGFAITRTESPWWKTSVRYEIATTVVDVDRRVEYGRVEVQLIRKVEGAIPEYPIFVSITPTLHYFLLDAVLDERAPELRPDIQAATGLSEDQIERSLKFWSGALETYAADILQGDFTLFTPMEAKVRARVRERPEVIKVYVPADTPPEEIARLEQEPGEPTGTIPVIVETYRYPARRRKKRPDDTEQPKS
jgi:hypothetical protein